MKQYFKNYLLAFLSVIFLTLISSCEEEDFLGEQTSETETESNVVSKENPLKVREVSKADIPNVLSKIKGKMSNTAKFYDNKIEQDDIQIYLDQIKEAVKKGQHSNYSFPMYVAGTPLTELYVMSIDKEIDGSIGEPIITKYDLSQESYDYFMNYNNGIIDFRYFQAAYSYYTFDEFFSNKANKTTDCQGTMGAGPGYYPTMPPGGSFINGTTVTGITVGFSNTIINTTSTYVYTSNVPSTNGQTSSVSTLATSSEVVSSPLEQPTAGTGIIPPVVISVPENTASVTQDVSQNNNGSSGGATCVGTINVGLDGGSSGSFACPQPDSGGNNNHSFKGYRTPTMCSPFDYSTINTLDLNIAQFSHSLRLPGGWLQFNREFYNPLKDFWNDSRQSTSDENFAQNLATAVKEEKMNEVEGMQALLEVNERNSSIEVVNAVSKVLDAVIDESIVTKSPFVKFPKDKAEQYKRDYPELTKFLENEIPKIANNEIIINAIKGVTDAPVEKIKEALQWGKGPEIVIEQLHGEGDKEQYGAYRGTYNPELRNKLYIDIDLVNDIENLKNSATFRREISFLIAVTILHEYNHLGDTVFGDNYWGELYLEDDIDENEAGAVFEVEIFGETVWRSNVGVIMRNFGNW